jgi:hypothetical protein
VAGDSPDDERRKGVSYFAPGGKRGKWTVQKVGPCRWRVGMPSGDLWANYNSWHVAYGVADMMARRYRWSK